MAMRRVLRYLDLPIIVLAMVGVVLGVWHFMLINRPQTTATVLSSSVTFVPTGGTRGYFRPAIRFRYQVSGRTWTSNKFAAGNDYWVVFLLNGKALAERVAAEFPAGAQVSAYYDPKDPSNAVLRRGLPGVFVMGTLLVWFIFSIGLQHFRYKFKKPPQGILVET